MRKSSSNRSEFNFERLFCETIPDAFRAYKILMANRRWLQPSAIHYGRLIVECDREFFDLEILRLNRYILIKYDLMTQHSIAQGDMVQQSTA